MSKYDPLGSDFIEDTYYRNLDPTPENRGLDFPRYLEDVVPTDNLIILPDPAVLNIGSSDLRLVMENRRSVRRYDTNQVLSFEELSYLLWLTQGVKKVSERSGMTLRTVPSAGARHPFETFLAVNRVENLVPGIYQFIALRHALILRKPGVEGINAVNHAALDQSQVVNSAVTFVWVAVPYRTCWRYGSRGYRYLYLDAGHICQNLHLAAESIDYGVCAIGAFDDEIANSALGLEGRERFVIYMASCGKKQIT